MIPGDQHVPDGDYRCERTPARETLDAAVAVLVGALFLAVVFAVLLLAGWLL